MTEQRLKELLEMTTISRLYPSGRSKFAVQKILNRDYVPTADYKFVNGASKYCLIFEDLPFVIKWSYGCNTIDEDEAFNEVEIYNKACELGLDFFFPTTEIFYQTDTITFIKQAKISASVSEVEFSYNYKKVKDRLVSIGHNASDKIVDKMSKEFRKTKGYQRELSSLWAKAALVIYGKRKCKALCKFIVDNNINDLHEANLGFIGFYPILLDFSGYHRGFV